VSAERDGKSYRFVSSALEDVDPAVARAQAAELARMLLGDTPTLLVGNLGSDPSAPSSPLYGIFVGAGAPFTDLAAAAGAGFPSCCRDLVCVDPTARLDRRVDFVLGSHHFAPSWGSWTGGNGAAMTGARWPSNHASIVAGVWLQ